MGMNKKEKKKRKEQQQKQFNANTPITKPIADKLEQAIAMSKEL
jgi:hypothetical protein